MFHYLINNNFEDPEYHYKLYFKKDYRKKKDFEIYSICDLIDIVFKDVFIFNKDKCNLQIKNINEHPLF